MPAPASPPPAPRTAPRRFPGSGRVVVALVFVGVLLVAVVVVSALLARSGSDDASGGVQEALAYIPSDASFAEIRSQQSAEQRLGVDGVDTGADGARIKRYLAEAQGSRWISNNYTDYLMTMNENGAAFTALDVDWSATVGIGSPGTGSVIQLYGMDAGLDLNSVADDMVSDGWRESDVADGRRLQPDFTAADPTTQMLGSYPAQVSDLVLLPREHLMVSGDYQRVLDVLAADSASLRTADDVTKLLGADDDPEYAFLTRGSQTCTDLAAIMGGAGTPSQVAQVREALGVPDFRTASATASLILADGTTVRTTSRLLFGSTREAAEDKTARLTYLREGSSVSTRQPIAQLLHVDSMTVEGVIESVDYSYERGPSEVLEAVAAGDLPPTLCLAG